MSQNSRILLSFKRQGTEFSICGWYAIQTKYEATTVCDDPSSLKVTRPLFLWLFVVWIYMYHESWMFMCPSVVQSGW